MPIPSVLVDELAEHLEGKNPEADAFVFTAPDGGALRHSNFYQRHFKPALVQAGLDPKIRFHDLRHTFASLLIAEGAHAKVIMERLGHSSITVTLNTYGHLLPSLEEELTQRLDATWRRARIAQPMTTPAGRESRGSSQEHNVKSRYPDDTLAPRPTRHFAAQAER